MKNTNLKPNKRLLPICYKIYEYLKNNACGYSKRVNSSTLCKEFDIKSNEHLRKYIRKIRNDETLQKVICSEPTKNGGYWIANNEEEIKNTLDDLYNRAVDMLKTYSSIKKKLTSDGQERITFSKYERDYIETILKGEEKHEKIR